MIKTRMRSFTLKRISDSLDAYGTKTSVPSTIATIDVSISINSQSTDYMDPKFTSCGFIGLTAYKGVLVGDLLTDGSVEYRVEVCGDPKSRYLTLWLK